MKKSILFVDDDVVTLTALKRLMRPFEHEWDLQFAEGATEALAILDEHDVGVIVTDLRMPGMDGVELLELVVENWPSAIRIIVSGMSDGPAMSRATGLAHQCLSKPCDPGDLADAIQRATNLRDKLSDQRLLELAARLEALPSVPHLYTQILQELRSPDGSMRSVGQVIAQDVGMTAKILKMVNSAFFGLNQEVNRVEDAVGFLGIETLRALVLSTELFQLEDGVREPSYVEELSRHGLRTAQLAKAIVEAEHGSRQDVDQAFLAGMLHDTGKLVLLNNVTEDADRAEEIAERFPRMLEYEAERRLMGASHADVGAYLLGIWGLPAPIVEAIAYHHTPSDSVGDDFSVLTAVHVANEMVHGHGLRAGHGLPGIDGHYLARIGRTGRLEYWSEVAGALLREFEEGEASEVSA